MCRNREIIPRAVKPLGEFETHARNRARSFFKESARPGIELESKGEGDLVESLGLYQ